MGEILAVTIFLAIFKLSIAAESYFFVIGIENDCQQKTLEIVNASLSWGKWVTPRGFDEVPPPNGRQWPPDHKDYISACGRMLTPTGVEGQFDLVDKSNDEHKMSQVYFDWSALGGITVDIKNFRSDVKCTFAFTDDPRYQELYCNDW